MSLDKLSIFSKDTDATEALRGYEYQKLRAVESWLSNYLDRKDEVIYCDYEEDIFQRDLSTWESKFRQLKLYSSKNFSFSSEEIIKAISHFFMLYVKGEYKFDEVQFVFETNVAVARSYGENEAALLQKWKNNQDSLDAKTLDECVNKVKSMIEEYIEQAIKGVKKDPVLLEQMESAKLVLKDIPLDTWQSFVKSIKWEFSEIAVDTTIENVVTNINDQIIKTSFPSAIHQKESVFARLYYAVAEKSIKENPEDRKLDNSLIESLLLDTGDNEDKQYNEDFQKWSEVKEINYFRAAEFYEVINLSGYSRYRKYLRHHAETWAGLLKMYIALDDTPSRNKQKAIYELLWTSLGVKMLQLPDGSLKGLEDYARTYFKNLEEFDDHESLEDAVSLLGIIRGAIAFDKADIADDEAEAWKKDVLERTLSALKTAKDDNEACYFHSIAAQLILQDISKPGYTGSLDDVFVHFDSLITKLDNAPLYDVRDLGGHINTFIKILVKLKHNTEDIERLEEFSEKLMPYVAKKSSEHDMAKTYVSRGAKYLESTEPKSILRALNYFHKAKSLWRNDGTKEGYILGLLNVAQLYAGLGSNLAAKYYALSAARHATENEAQHKRISDAYRLILHADFKQGVWVSALEDFRMFIVSRDEYTNGHFLSDDELLLKSAAEVSFIMAVAPRISPQLNGLIDFEKTKMVKIYTDFLAHQVAYIEENVADDQLFDLISNKLDDKPLNDLGPERTITWKALGSEWKITFDNTWLLNSLGEEFTAMLQILVTEFGLSKLDLHLIKAPIEIKIEVGESWEPPVRQPSNTVHKWVVKMPAIMGEDYSKIKMQPGFVLVSVKTILDEISLLSKDELFNEIQRMFKKEELAAKTFPDFIYQRTYRYLLREEIFNEYRRACFQKLD